MKYLILCIYAVTALTATYNVCMEGSSTAVTLQDSDKLLISKNFKWSYQKSCITLFARNTSDEEFKLLSFCCNPTIQVTIADLLQKANITEENINKKFSLLIQQKVEDKRVEIQADDVTLLGLLFASKKLASFDEIPHETDEELVNRIGLSDLEKSIMYTLLKQGAQDSAHFENMLTAGGLYKHMQSQ